MLKTNIVYIYDNYQNTAVIQKYLEIIGKAFKRCGYKCEFIKRIDNSINKKALIVFPLALDAFKYYFKGYKNIVLWQQGAGADESYMRNKSKLRYYVLNFIDCFMMKKSKFILYVSDFMRTHYEKLSHCSFERNSYIMPCFNENFDERIFEKKEYDKRVFAYVGSLAVWQCFESTLEIYLQIEKRFPDAFLKVLTFQIDEAKKLLEEKGIKNYEIKCVTSEEVKKELLEVTYGFVIREDNIVNRVATPTKLSSYLSAGVIPIYSKCLLDFDCLRNKRNCSFGLDDRIDIETLFKYLNRKCNKKVICNEISDIFNTYYNSEFHIDRISEKLRRILK